MNFSKKHQSFAKAPLIGILVALIMCVGLSVQVMANPVPVQVVDDSDSSIIEANPGDTVDIYIRLDNVEEYYEDLSGYDPPFDPADPGDAEALEKLKHQIQAIQFVFTYDPSALEINEDAGNPIVEAFGVTAGSGDPLLEAWPVYAKIVKDVGGNPIGELNVCLSMNPVDPSDPNWSEDLYDVEPEPYPDLTWNPSEIYSLRESGKVLRINATVGAVPGDYELSLAEIQDVDGNPLAILNEKDKDTGEDIIPSEVAPGTLHILPTAVVEIVDVRVSYITSASATITWMTKDPDTGEFVNTANNTVSYGTSCDDLTVIASDPVDSAIHFVTISEPPQIAGLDPETQYFFKVTSNGTTYPENPGDCLDFTTTKSGLGTPYTIFGRVVYDDGTLGPDAVVPVERALVFLTIGTSYPMSALTDGSGTWFLNLQDLKDSETGDPYIPVPGEIVHLEAQGASLGTGKLDVELSGDSPQDTGDTIISPTETREITLVTGFTMVGLPLSPTDDQGNPRSIDSYDLLPEIPDSVAVIGWDPETQRTLQAFYPFPGGPIIGDHFPIIPGGGYYIQANDDTAWQLIGKPIEEALTYSFVTGFTMFSIPFPKDCFDSYALLADIPCAVAVIGWDPETQRTLQAFYPFPGGPIIGDQFPISDDNGLYLQASEPCEWTPVECPVAAPTLTNVGTFVPPKLFYKNTPEIMGVTASNLTATATIISWYTNVSSDGMVYYGTSRNLSQMKVESRRYSQNHLVRLKGLNPNTTYYYQVKSGNQLDNAHGSYYTFTTASFGIGQMYPIYGQLLEPDGKTPASDRLVYITVQKGLDTSISLAAITDARGYWNVNLADLKTNDGQVFDYQVGDEIHIKVAASNFEYTDKVIGTPTQNIGSHVLPLHANLVDNHLVPAKSMLHQNYPNPFNPETWIPYQLSESADVSITIYNSVGQIVRMINLTNQPAGLYLDKTRAAYWDGKNEAGESVSSGIYFYTIRAENFSATRKMVILK